MGGFAIFVKDFIEEHYTNNPYVLVGVAILAVCFIYSIREASTFSELMDIIFKWILFPLTIINFFEELFEGISKNSEKREPTPQKKPLNQIQKFCIIFMVIGFATWLVHYGWKPERTAIGFVIFFGSLASFFVFKNK